MVLASLLEVHDSACFLEMSISAFLDASNWLGIALVSTVARPEHDSDGNHIQKADAYL
jgi:hypothetical protein